MFYLIVINNTVGPANLLVCATCLTLLFFESAFGTCLACKVYNVFAKNPVQYCLGGVCEVTLPHASQKVGFAGTLIVASFMGAVVLLANQYFPPTRTADAQVASTSSDSCTVPWWAEAIGHKDKWKLHNNCT